MISTTLERQAVTKALKARMAAGVGNVPICPYDFALGGGVSVRFMAVSSMEGVYDRRSETIVVSSLRPRGRRAFTCAHEYAHHVFGHGEHIDELPEDRKHPRPEQEILADRFAGFLLMPPALVSSAFKGRGIDPATCTAAQAYAMSCWLGVSYGGFVTHASLALEIMPRARAADLRKVTPKQIKADLLPGVDAPDVVVVDERWNHAVDLTVGDFAVVPAGATLEGNAAEIAQSRGDATIIRANLRGFSRVLCGDWAAYVRVMPNEYEGLARHRHFPEAEDA
jgi:hypothetical protein